MCVPTLRANLPIARSWMSHCKSRSHDASTLGLDTQSNYPADAVTRLEIVCRLVDRVERAHQWREIGFAIEAQE